MGLCLDRNWVRSNAFETRHEFDVIGVRKHVDQTIFGDSKPARTKRSRILRELLGVARDQHDDVADHLHHGVHVSAQPAPRRIEHHRIEPSPRVHQTRRVFQRVPTNYTHVVEAVAS